MTILQAIVLGVVEGLTEYLPISSTGHLILASDLMHMADTPAAKTAVDAFEIVIQGGAILAVLGVYFPRVMQMIQGLLGKNRDGLKLFINLVIAFLPAAVIGLLLEKYIDAYLFSPVPVVAALALGGVLMIVMEIVERRKKKRTGVSTAEPGHAKVTITTLSPMHALGIGLFQVVSMWPGTSRSMMTIVGGRLLGMSTVESAEFSFLLGLPTLGAATCYKLLKNHREIAGLGSVPVVVGIIVATITAAIAVKWLVAYLTKHGLEIFGYYRLILAAVIVLALSQGWMTIEKTQTAPAQTQTAPVVPKH